MAVPVTPLENEKLKKFMALQKRDIEPRGRYGPGGCVLKMQYESSAQVVKDFEIREDDVWVITPPKCGTTWTQEMVWLLVQDFDYERARNENLMMRFPYMEFSRFISEEFKREYLNNMDTVDLAANLTPPRTIKSHLPKYLLPDQLWTKKPKIIYVAREPKDAAYSFYHHEKLLGDFSGDTELFFDCFYDDLVGYCPFWEHVMEFWKMRDEPYILFNTYEEMKKDLPAVIRKTAKFLNKSVTEEEVERLAEHLDIKNMRKNPSVNLEEKLAKKREEGVISKEQGFIRKGEVGEGRREMSEEMAKKFDERTRRTFPEAAGGCPWAL